MGVGCKGLFSFARNAARAHAVNVSQRDGARSKTGAGVVEELLLAQGELRLGA
jgi:hypothetical protein